MKSFDVFVIKGFPVCKWKKTLKSNKELNELKRENTLTNYI